MITFDYLIGYWYVYKKLHLSYIALKDQAHGTWPYITMPYFELSE